MEDLEYITTGTMIIIVKGETFMKGKGRNCRRH